MKYFCDSDRFIVVQTHKNLVEHGYFVDNEHFTPHPALASCGATQHLHFDSFRVTFAQTNPSETDKLIQQ